MFDSYFGFSMHTDMQTMDKYNFIQENRNLIFCFLGMACALSALCAEVSFELSIL